MSLEWDRRFMRLAREVASWSKDPSTKVGVVLVKDRKVVATGYNGFPPGIADDSRLRDREQKYRLIVHAEMNALLQAGHDARGATLYQYGFLGGHCCDNCTKHVITAGVARVVCMEGPIRAEWYDEIKRAKQTFYESAVKLSEITI
jgi:dCMP deaminase